MKRILGLILCILLVVPGLAMAAVPDISGLTTAEKNQLLKALLNDMEPAAINTLLTARLDKYDSDSLVALQQILTAEMDSRADLQPEVSYKNGDRSDEVKAIQLRLIELNYLSGSADGAFGKKTEEAVRMFQKDANLPVTGVVDRATLNALNSPNAPVAKVYLDLDFNAISRDPDRYSGKYYKFSGRVLQVLEGSSWNGTTTVNLRVATKGRYDNVVYVVYERPDNESRILEDDRVTVYGMCDGLYSYTAVMGNTITLPSFEAESVTVD